MEEQVAQKSTELEQYLLRVRELEDMYGQLEDALEDERRARQDEEAVRRLQARSVYKEWARDKCFEAPCILEIFNKRLRNQRKSEYYVGISQFRTFNKKKKKKKKKKWASLTLRQA